jgi:hypothetical protein
MRLTILPEYSQVVNGQRITIKNVKVHVWDDGEAFPATECRRFERAVEKVFPGWYHRFTKTGKHRKNCVSCRRYGKMGTKRG